MDDQTAPQELTMADLAAMDDAPEMAEAELPEAAPAEAEPAPAPAPAEEAPSPAPEAKQPSMVPHAALHQAREKQKEAERKLQEIMAMIEAAAQEQQGDEVKIPDPILDPNGFRKFQADQIKQHAQKLAEIERRQQETQQEQVLMQRLAQDVGQFRAATPDYDAALQFAVNARRSELSLFGRTPEQVEAQLEVDMRGLVGIAYDGGRNPGELFYEYAKTRGYSGQPAPAPAAQGQVAAFAAAQRNSQSLASASGPASDGGATLAGFARMSEKELSAMSSDQRTEMLRKAMGG